MSAWLASFLAAFATKLVELLGHDIEEIIARRRAQKANQDAADSSVKPLKDAQTGKEIDGAIDDALNHL